MGEGWRVVRQAATVEESGFKLGNINGGAILFKSFLYQVGLRKANIPNRNGNWKSPQI
jgi:hypothetical protein